MHLLTVPFIWLVLIPVALLDLFMEIYHRICFPIYGLPLVQRSKYIIFDRYKLNYLSFLDKLNCTYCAYVNGVLPYLSEIAAETEKYWCGIKHERYNGIVPAHHKDFLNYADKESFEKTCKLGKTKKK